MVRETFINPRADEPLLGVKVRLENPEPLLKQVGAIGVSGAQRAFDDQALGEFAWPHRYPNQDDPYINIAGALVDLNHGGVIKTRRFQRRPALQDTNFLRGSISSEVRGGDTAVWGSSAPYAGQHQAGLVSDNIPVTDKTKQGIAKFLLTDRGATYRPKMTWLLLPAVTSYQVELARRPFIGITPEMKADMIAATEAFVAGRN